MKQHDHPEHENPKHPSKPGTGPSPLGDINSPGVDPPTDPPPPPDDDVDGDINSPGKGPGG